MTNRPAWMDEPEYVRELAEQAWERMVREWEAEDARRANGETLTEREATA